MATAPSPPAAPVHAEAAPGERSAAFFDLDRTLMSGSSGFFWARAAAGAGLISKRRLGLDARANAHFRLRGSSDAATEKVMRRVADMLVDQRVLDFQRL